mmetsp:Transcript_20652/g.57569  ORF Transcript_20652/g.57569 Transcript_20652/m.57569 type:complete len:349 (+) Transcript_20652:60-1106(+)
MLQSSNKGNCWSCPSRRPAHLSNTRPASSTVMMGKTEAQPRRPKPSATGGSRFLPSPKPIARIRGTVTLPVVTPPASHATHVMPSLEKTVKRVARAYAGRRNVDMEISHNTLKTPMQVPMATPSATTVTSKRQEKVPPVSRSTVSPRTLRDGSATCAVKVPMNEKDNTRATPVRERPADMHASYADAMCSPAAFPRGKRPKFKPRLKTTRPRKTQTIPKATLRAFGTVSAKTYRCRTSNPITSGPIERVASDTSGGPGICASGAPLSISEAAESPFPITFGVTSAFMKAPSSRTPSTGHSDANVTMPKPFNSSPLPPGDEEAPRGLAPTPRKCSTPAATSPLFSRAKA